MKNSLLLTYSTSVTYTYDSDGIRGTKKVNGIKSSYHYVGGQLRYETRGNLKFYYFYDASGNLSAIRYSPNSGTTFYMYYTLTNQFELYKIEETGKQDKDKYEVLNKI